MKKPPLRPARDTVEGRPRAACRLVGDRRCATSVASTADVEVVRGVSLDIREGEIFGLLGPNGAGKTTLLSMISTRIRPTSGDAWVHGKHVVHDVDAARRLLNVAPQEEALYPSLTAEENLKFFADLYGVPRAERRKRRARSARGRRADGAQAGPRLHLLGRHAPPAQPGLRAGERPAARAARRAHRGRRSAVARPHLRRRAGACARAASTILYTTHYLEEAEDLCDRIAIMDEGRVVACGTLPELLALSYAHRGHRPAAAGAAG